MDAITDGHKKAAVGQSNCTRLSFTCWSCLAQVKKDASMLDAFGKGASEDIQRAKDAVYKVCTCSWFAQRGTDEDLQHGKDIACKVCGCLWFVQKGADEGIQCAKGMVYRVCGMFCFAQRGIPRDVQRVCKGCCVQGAPSFLGHANKVDKAALVHRREIRGERVTDCTSFCEEGRLYSFLATFKM
eukprot:1160275-Pelagomonas_calceolata.AAC.4